ncbi:MAG: S-layer homology domain-containing protein [Oscillospiraceae bacterium]|nr:S-layer homology domain-containing protein [Oscillospiraceae bacterium]
MGKRMIWLLSALLLLCGILSPSSLAAEDAAYEDALWKNGVYESTLGDMAGRRLYVYGIVDSDGEITEQSTDKNTVLNADQPAGRLDAALYFYRLCGRSIEVACPFSDVPEEYAEAVAWLFAEGIVKGIGNGMYGVGDLTEYQALVILSRLLGWETEDRDTLYAIAEAEGLLPLDRQEEVFTRGELFQILCALAESYFPERCVPVRAEMSKPNLLSIQANSYESAKRQLEAAAVYVPARIAVTFLESCPMEDVEAFALHYDWDTADSGFPLISALNLTYRKPCSLVRYSDRRYELKMPCYSSAYLAFADTLDWLRVYSDEAFSRCMVEFVEQTVLPLRELPTEYERARAAHDLLCELTEYDYEYFNRGRDEAHRILGFFIHRKVVCDGYANVYQWMLAYLGTKSYVVVGKAEGSHAWNKVQLEGAWYNVDVCWSDTGSDQEKYFLKSDAWFEANDHSFTDPFPASAFASLKDYGE